MNWKLKCMAFYALIPFGHRGLGFMQKHVTGRANFRATDEQLRRYGHHVQVYSEMVRQGSTLEFGAGRNLITPLLLSAAGATACYAYDIDRLATVELVNGTIRQLRGRLPGDWPEVADLGDDLIGKYRINYRAPAEINELPDGRVDFIYSTSTLEHVPQEAISGLLHQCIRVASPRAVMSFRIDYADHYAISDRSITPFNFYRYTEKQWRVFNPSNHHQNRLRHTDFERIFSDLKFLKNTRNILDESLLDGIPVAEPFRRYSKEDLLTRGGHFVLKR
jgi:hypothetical protein